MRRVPSSVAAPQVGCEIEELEAFAGVGLVRGAVLKASGWEFDPERLAGFKAYLALAREKLARWAEEES